MIDAAPLTAYLTTAFRTASQDLPEFGKTYEADIRLAPGGTVRCELHFSPDRASICVSEPIPIWIADPFDYWIIRLPEPVPPALARLIDELR